MTSERARPECDVRSRNALAAGTEQGSRQRVKKKLNERLMLPVNTTVQHESPQNEFNRRSVLLVTKQYNGCGDK